MCVSPIDVITFCPSTSSLSAQALAVLGGANVCFVYRRHDFFRAHVCFAHRRHHFLPVFARRARCNFTRSWFSTSSRKAETPVDGGDGCDGVKCVCSACVGCVCLCPESLQGGRCSCHCHDPQGFTQALAPLEQRNSLRFSFCSCARLQACCGPVSNPRHLTQNFAENCPEAVSGRLHS